MQLKTRLLYLLCFLILGNLSAQDSYYWTGNGKLMLNQNHEFWIIHTKNIDGFKNLAQRKSIKGISELTVSTHNKFVVVKAEQAMQESEVITALGLGRNILDASPAHELEDGFLIYPMHQIVFQPKNKAHIKQLYQILGAYKHGKLAQKHGVYRVKMESIHDVFNAANALYESGLASFAHPDFYAEKTHYSDPLFSEQFQMHNTGQTIDGVAGVNDMDCNALEAWGISLGSSGITVAVIDDGVEAHEDLSTSGGASRVVGGYTPVNGGNGAPSGSDRHGQACAGIIAASHNNIGVQGVAPLVQLLSVDIFAGGETAQQIADGITWAKNNGTDVMSNSWGYNSCTLDLPSINNALADAANNGRGGKGCVIVFASGNGYKSCVDYPANNNDVIAVGAFTNQGVRSGYSNYGSALDIMAPSNGGAGVRTTDRQGSAGYSSGNYTTTFGGTSAACPVVSGVTALMLGYNSSLTQSQVKNILYSTSIDMGSPGVDNEYANGRVNAYGALQAIGGTPPTCNDGVQNGNETGVDCGGSSCPPCVTCNDGIQNGDETGVDCGGSSCPPCGSNCTENEVTFTITLDDYPSETSWAVMDANGNTVASGNNYTNPGSTAAENLCLADGCYDLVVYDSYGDGICCSYGNGSYSLTDDNGNVLASGGNFGSSETTNFCLLPPPSCDDGIQNGDEEGVDCGGSSCPPCSGSCTENTATLTINLDNYPSETTWSVTSSNGNVIASGGPYSVAGSTVVEELCLADGCYDLNFNDSYGDGICCSYGNGSYSLTDDNGNVLASGGQFGSSETTNFCLNNSSASYCEAQGTSNSYEWIQSVAFGSINNTSGNNGGYADYTGISTTINTNSNVSMTLIPGFASSSYTEYWRVWIDFNQDGDFDDSGELVNEGSGSSTLTGTAYIPANASSGATRMRVAMQYNAYPASCGSFTYGEVEDYTVVISSSLNGGGTFSQTDIGLEVIGNETTYRPALQVYPNPAQQYLNIDFNSRINGEVTIELFNLIGQQIKLLPSNASEGNNVYRLEIGDLPDGAYLIRLKAGSEQYTEKLTITK